MRRIRNAWLMALALALPSSAAWADETRPPADAPPLAGQQAQPPAGPGLDLDDPVEAFTPAKPRTARDADRLQALALFAAARMAEQKQDYPRALRAYQRAWRLDPHAELALREIVPLAFSLDRQAEAVRYALIMAEREPIDAVMLRRLAVYLTEEGNLARALGLYEKALTIEPNDKTPATGLALRLEMGRLAFVTKKFDAAAARFAEVSQALANPDKSGLDAAAQKTLVGKPELTYQLFGEGFLEAGRLDEALAAFEKVQQVKPDLGLYNFNRARVEARQKQPAQALVKLQICFDKHVANQGTAPFQLLADLLAQLGLESQLIARLEKLNAADPDNMALAYFLAGRYRQAGQLDKAEAIYLKLLETHKSRPPLEAYQSLIDVYREQKNAEKLLTTLGDAVSRVSSLSPLGDSGKALQADAELSARVVALARERLAADPDKLPYGQRLAAALLAVQLKDLAAAGALFDQALAADKEKASDTLLTWGLELFAAGQYAEAIKIFERGLADKILPEKDARLHFYLAGALEMDGRTDQAIAEARTAAEKQSDAPRFESRIPWILYHAKRYDEARQGYLALLEKHDKIVDSPDVREVMRDARLALSNLCVLENKLDESQEWIEQVLDEFPEDTSALNDLGYLWADAGKHLDRALEMVQAAVVSEPKNMAYRDSLGWALFRLGRFDEAAAELKVAASEEDTDGVILDHLAEALHKAGDASGASDAWKRAGDYFDKHGEPDKAKQAREKISRIVPGGPQTKQ